MSEGLGLLKAWGVGLRRADRGQRPRLQFRASHSAVVGERRFCIRLTSLWVAPSGRSSCFRRSAFGYAYWSRRKLRGDSEATSRNINLTPPIVVRSSLSATATLGSRRFCLLVYILRSAFYPHVYR
jgi:hypothetical protein